MNPKDAYICSIHGGRIVSHYLHAIEKHPHFCDKITYLSESGADTHLKLCRKILESSEYVGGLGAVDVIWCEVYEAIQAYTHGDTAHAIEELYDCIAVLLRTIDVLEGRQKLRKPETKGETNA